MKDGNKDLIEVIPKTGIKGKEIEECKLIVKSNTYTYEVKLINTGGRCMCKEYVTSVKDYKKVKLIHNKDVSIIYKKRRFKCLKCNKTFYELNLFNEIYKQDKITDNCVNEILLFLKRYNHTFLETAQRFNVSVSKIIEVFDSYVQIPPHSLREVISIDEFYFSRRSKHKYAFLIIGLNGDILDILESRLKSTLLDYFKSISLSDRRKVKYICSDMNEVYRQVIQRRFGRAIHAIDSFHVIAYINKALKDYLLALTRSYMTDKKSDEYYLLKKCKNLLFIDKDEFKHNKHFNMMMHTQELVNLIFKIDDKIKLLYELKEEYKMFNSNWDKYSMDEVYTFLDYYIEECLKTNVTEFINIANTISNWREEIANSFISYKGKRISNGKIENRNHYIKLMKYLANGYSNFKRFRNRVMYVENLNDKASNVKHTKIIKRIMPKRRKNKDNY